MHVQLHPTLRLSKMMLAVTAAVLINSTFSPLAVAETAPTATAAPMQCATETTPRYTKTPTGYLM
ncbi:MAG: PPC domain-containing DNA-binding protein, partial [Pseudomonas fluorescens]